MTHLDEDPDVVEVVAGELRLQDPATRAGAAELLHRGFREFGASGRVWDRESILDLRRDEDAPPPVTDDIAATRLAPDVILLSYRARRPDRTSVRSSIWRRDGDGDGPWRLFFHQGTILRHELATGS